MITEQALVTHRDGKRVEVRLLRDSACGHCELGKSCGTGAIGRLLGNRKRPLSFECGEPLSPGDRVELALSEAALVRSSLTIYGLPLLGMLAAGLSAALAGFGEFTVIAVSVAGFYLAIKFAAWLSRRLEQQGLKPHIVGIRVNPASQSGS